MCVTAIYFPWLWGLEVQGQGAGRPCSPMRMSFCCCLPSGCVLTLPFLSADGSVSSSREGASPTEAFHPWPHLYLITPKPSFAKYFSFVWGWGDSHVLILGACKQLLTTAYGYFFILETWVWVFEIPFGIRVFPDVFSRKWDFFFFLLALNRLDANVWLLPLLWILPAVRTFVTVWDHGGCLPKQSQTHLFCAQNLPSSLCFD